MPAIGLDIGKVIFEVLKTDAALVSLVGNISNIQPSAIYTSSPKAGIYYDILSVDNENTKTTDKAELTVVTFQIECFKPTYGGLISLGAKVQELLDKLAAGTYSGISIQSCIMESQSTDFDGNNKLYYLQQTYKSRLT